MGNSLSAFGGPKKVQALINKLGLPLQIDYSNEEEPKVPLSTFTEAYPAPGWFTGVKSAITIQKPVLEVYDSLSRDLHHVFTPMSECDDEVKEDDGAGKQVIFRIVRIPFKVAFVTGNLKLRLNVEQDRNAGKIHFESAKEGRLITRFIADFDIHASKDRPEETVVRLDSKVSCKSLPPAPFRNMVKDVMVKKMDSCMLDLLQYHKEGDESDDEFESASETSVDNRVDHERPQGTGFMDFVRSLSAPLRRSMELFEGRRSIEKPKPRIEDTAHEDLGHTPAAAPAAALERPPSFAPPHLGGADSAAPPQLGGVDGAAAARSAFYKASLSVASDDSESPSGDSNNIPSQASVFAEWQEKEGIQQTPPRTLF